MEGMQGIRTKPLPAFIPFIPVKSFLFTIRLILGIRIHVEPRVCSGTLVIYQITVDRLNS